MDFNKNKEHSLYAKINSIFKYYDIINEIKNNKDN